MGKRDPLLIFLILFLLLSFRVNAGADIGFGAVTLSSDTVKPDDTLIVYTSLINYGPGDFDGMVDFSIAINGVENVNRSIIDNPLQGLTIYLPPSDSFALEFHVVVRQQYLVPGSDIFVVWPILANGNNVQDSLMVRITVNAGDPAGINEPGMPKLKLYYSNQLIVIDYPIQPEPAQIRIFDIDGREVYTTRMETNCIIPFYHEVAGIYFVEITFVGDVRKVFKVVKMDR